jgi:DegV family protein with EDD domain
VYSRLIDSGYDVVSIHISVKLSGTLNSALAARESLGANSRIVILDSFQASMGLGLIVMAVARTASDGAPLEQVAARARYAIGRANTVVMVDTLEYLHKGGRIGKAQAFLGGLLKVKPIIRVHDGEAYPLERPRTRARALERLRRWAAGFSPTALAVMHSTTPDEAASFVNSLDRSLPRESVYIGQFGPVMGTYLGPGALGVTLLEG